MVDANTPSSVPHQSSVRASVVVGMSPPSVAGALREVFDADAKSLARALDSRDASTTTRVGLALDVLVSHAANDLDAVFEPSLERVVACRGARCAFVALACACCPVSSPPNAAYSSGVEPA